MQELERYPFDLHIGVASEDVQRVHDISFAAEFPSDVGPIVYSGDALGGSSWEQWGEGPWGPDDANEEHPVDTAEHVVIRCSTYTEAYMALAELRAESVTLIPMRWPNQKGVIATLTQSEDWAEAVWSLKAGPEYDRVDEPEEEPAPTIGKWWVVQAPGVATFYLDGAVQGIIGRKHAAQIASQIVGVKVSKGNVRLIGTLYEADGGRPF